MEKQTQFDQSRNSSGFFSFEAHTEEKSPTCELKNEKINSDFACEREDYGKISRSWQTERHEQMGRIPQLEYEKEELHKRVDVLEEELEKKEIENNDLLEEIGRLEFEKDVEKNKQKRQKVFQQIYVPKQNTAEGDVVNDQTHTKGAYSQLSVSTEQPIGITTTLKSLPDEENATNDITHTKFGLKPDEPCTSESSASTNTQQPIDMTETLTLVSAPDEDRMYQVPHIESSRDDVLDENCNLSSRLLPCYDKNEYYKDLLKVMGKVLLHDDVLKLKEWASKKFSIDRKLNAADILSRLDQNKSIDTLSELRSFFDSITRTDNVYRIDEFLQGNYI